MRGWTLVGPVLGLVVGTVGLLPAQPFRAADPGVRGGPPGAGGPIAGLTPREAAFFEAGRLEFEKAHTIASGLGPRFNLDSCAACHVAPANGGSSPALNPQVPVSAAFGARNILPSFIIREGPVREVRVRFREDGTRDGSVHPLFVISGRQDGTGDATGCGAVQDDLDAQGALGNLSFRIPTPLFGTGLVEQVPAASILASHGATAAARAALAIGGRPNRVVGGRVNVNPNDRTISRFGWKAQNQSLLLFAGEAYNVEMGISNELFQSERDEAPECQFAATPNSVTSTDSLDPLETLSAIERFAFFMRFLAPPEPSPDAPGGALSLQRGRALFDAVGCALCHTPTLQTGASTVAALDRQAVNLYSDLLLHDMGSGLGDEVVQGLAGPRDFRTAPLWGLGQRIFFLHDGRTRDLREAIEAHRTVGRGGRAPSEANAVVKRFDALTEPQKQDVLNFLRSL
jgi:CxxC motif-containing protein (DUF1111 family)